MSDQIEKMFGLEDFTQHQAIMELFLRSSQGLERKRQHSKDLQHSCQFNWFDNIQEEKFTEPQIKKEIMKRAVTGTDLQDDLKATLTQRAASQSSP